MIEAAANIALDKPVDAFPGTIDFGKRRVTSSPWSKSMTMNSETWFVKRFKYGANYFLDQLFCPGRHPQSTLPHHPNEFRDG